MKSPKTKENLILTVIERIKEDVHCGDIGAIEEIIKVLPIENLIAYLPEEDWKQFKHLRHEKDNNS